jgi:hypothetical protein
MDQKVKTACGRTPPSVFPSIWHSDDGAEVTAAQVSPQATRAELIGSDMATAAGLKVVAYTLVLALCRKLIAAGHDPHRPLHAYRGDVLCLRIRTIGEAATWRSTATGPVLDGSVRRTQPHPFVKTSGLV